MVKSAVKVAVRIRPTANFAQNEIIVHESTKTIGINLSKRKQPNVVNNVTDNYSFKFDHILHNASQETVFEECAKDIVDSVIEGYNGTIMCYGQTGAGKTFTMTGGGNDYKHRGLIPRAIAHIFHEIHQRPENANDEEEALSYMFEGDTNRAIAEHQLNKGSTRSHCIFTIHVETRSRVESEGKTLHSKLNLVDLAGSERVGKTHSEGQVLNEAKYINKSLTFLEQVVIALSTPGREHVPYRQTKLTNVIKDSLGGNCRTLMIANIWGESQHLEETLSTLKFAKRMMRVSNDAVVNVYMDPQALIKKYEREIADLKRELAMHDQLQNKSHVTYDEYNEEQRHELGKVVRKFLRNEIDDIEVVNLRHVKEIMLQFREIVKNMRVEVEEDLRRHFTLTDKQDGERTTTTKTKHHDEEDGVGDVDGEGGFGIGVAMAATKSSSKPSRQSSAAPAKEGGAVPLSGATTMNDNGSNANKKKDDGDDAKPPAPDRNQEYIRFKSEEGAETNKILKENLAAEKEKKKRLKELSASVNKTKREIDAIKLKIDEKKHQRELMNAAANNNNNDNGADDTDNVIDEEEFAYLRTMKSLKKQYREQYEELKMVKSELEFVSRLVDQTRQKLIMDFEEWFRRKYGDDETAETSNETGTGAVRDDGEVLDEGEVFDKLEMQRIMQEDPDGAAFYNARKNIMMAKTQRKKPLLSKKR